MINQFEISNYVKKQIQTYLSNKECDLATAMNDETMNADVAAILHDGFPTMVKKIYSLPKFQSFFWEKRELLQQHIANRLAAADKPRKGK
ncbi:hypothetical protein [Alysiella filiformis]|uniref:Uncharacterized protein n=1 Tax=Alysiella filiformis DSM 16848 TaxID=1120981 RepID=A0A286EDS7_9NEIS|nr:hypothetical protein [Alysiella filiformis]QMT31718.1 hypothetical protein H3L97_02130 [Alysiella filiformis]UBQ55271.1 hypothetical protein JF568_06545 [Alysiella filiformis DSM 16848]SOD68994.1 hypothetical protein SAMN02746062_01473 [Alysiella filiformis DSM 16848]